MGLLKRRGVRCQRYSEHGKQLQDTLPHGLSLAKSFDRRYARCHDK
jgi:hypothetical protein